MGKVLGGPVAIDELGNVFQGVFPEEIVALPLGVLNGVPRALIDRYRDVLPLVASFDRDSTTALGA